MNNLGYRIVWSFLMARDIFRLVKCHLEVARAGKFGGVHITGVKLKGSVVGPFVVKIQSGRIFPTLALCANWTLGLSLLEY